ncbi:hypothetical protein V6N13_130274 [Hibiscus sabdariffa]
MQFLHVNRPDLIAFFEPRISDSTADSVISSFGSLNSHRVEAIGFFVGIWLAWSDSISVDIIYNHFQFIHCRVTTKGDNNSFFTQLSMQVQLLLDAKFYGNICSILLPPFIHHGFYLGTLMQHFVTRKE